jgi:hypothetical protein
MSKPMVDGGRWQCSGCHWVFTGGWQRRCIACGRIDYWCGSVDPNGDQWPGERVDELRAQLAIAEKERDRLNELLDAPPYVDCICPGCPRKVPQAWTSGMCEPCALEDCEHTDGARAVAAERDEIALALEGSQDALASCVASENALAARVAQLARLVELARIVVKTSDSDTCSEDAQTEALFALADALDGK